MINKNMYIYCITNIVNDKKYVGQTSKDPYIRWNQHKADAKRLNRAIHMAMRKYGIDNFIFEVINESASNIDELNDLEEFYVSFYDTFKGHGYNMNSGGDHVIHSDETKEKIRQSSLGRKHSDETKKKMSESRSGEKNPNYGKTFSNEHKLKMSKTRRGRNGIQSHSSKKIIQLDKDTGQEIACWFSMNEVQRELGIYQSSISRCCRGKLKSTGGFVWKYM